MARAQTARRLNHLASTSLIGLIALCLAWELWLAPLRPGGSWLVLKVLPLMAPLFGVLHARRYTHQWASMLVLLYFVEGVVRANSERGMGAVLAVAEIALALTFFFATAFFARMTAAASNENAPKKPDEHQ